MMFEGIIPSAVQPLLSDEEEQIETRTETVIMTGATRGIGRAIAERLLADNPQLRIINIGRSTHQAVSQNLDYEHARATFPNVSTAERIQFVGEVDLASKEAFKGALEQIIAETRGKIKLRGVIHCAGQAVLCDDFENADTVTHSRVETMKHVNKDAAIVLAKKLMGENLMDETTPFIYVSSLGAYPNRAGVPGLKLYAQYKEEALVELRELFNEKNIPLCIAYPGATMTGMVFAGADDRATKGEPDGFIKSVDCGLEFFGAAPEDALPSSRLVTGTAEATMSGQNAKPEIFGARIPELYVKFCNFLKVRPYMLPVFVQIFGKQMLDAIGQGKAEHEARLAYHQQHNSYGAQMNYNRLKFSKLWPSGISRTITKYARKWGLL